MTRTRPWWKRRAAAAVVLVLLGGVGVLLLPENGDKGVAHRGPVKNPSPSPLPTSADGREEWFTDLTGLEIPDSAEDVEVTATHTEMNMRQTWARFRADRAGVTEFCRSSDHGALSEDPAGWDHETGVQPARVRIDAQKAKRLRIPDGPPPERGVVLDCAAAPNTGQPRSMDIAAVFDAADAAVVYVRCWEWASDRPR